jgi:hypothetical protein
MHFPAASNPTFNYTGVSSSTIDAKGINGTAYYSLMAMYYPATSVGWTNLALQNGWVSFDAVNNANATPQYIKHADGMVTVKGLIKNGNTSVDFAIANLPPGYRPKETLVIHGTAWGAYSRLDVQPNGDIIVVAANSGWTSLDAITFMAEQ